MLPSSLRESLLFLLEVVQLWQEMVEAYKSGQKLEQSASQKVTLRVNYSMYIISHTQSICTELLSYAQSTRNKK